MSYQFDPDTGEYMKVLDERDKLRAVIEAWKVYDAYEARTPEEEEIKHAMLEEFRSFINYL